MPHTPPARAAFVGSFPSLASLPTPDLPEIAMAGRSNVGKSSAINALLGTNIARVSRTPGRTQALNLFQVGDTLTLVDLPGYGYARVPEQVRQAWKGMIEGYLAERPSLVLVVLLVDASVPAQNLDRELIAGLVAAYVPLRVLATRVDKLTKSARKPTLKKLTADLGLADDQLMPVSSKTGENIDLLWRILAKTARGER